MCVVNDLSSNNWRKSLVPAPAVIPAPVAYAKVAVVKKLVVGIGLILWGLPVGLAVRGSGTSGGSERVLGGF